MLARPFADGETPHFTGTEIARCTGLPPSAVTNAMNRLERDGYLHKELAPPETLRPGQRPLIYSLREQEDGQPFFRPQARPGCERTRQQGITESLHEQQSNVLAYLADASMRGARSITVAGAAARANVRHHMANHAFSTFEKAGMVAPTSPGAGRRAAQYRITRLGEWLVDGRPEPPPSPLYVRQPREGDDNPTRARRTAAREIDVGPTIEPWLMHAIATRYPDQYHQPVADRALRFLQNGVLQYSRVEGSQTGETAPTPGPKAPRGKRGLWYSEVANSSLGTLGQEVIAHWTGLDILLFGRRLARSELCRALAVSNEDFVETAKTRYYQPLIAELQKQDLQ